MYGKDTQAPTPTDDSPLLDDASKKPIQQVVGSFLYYARAVDPTILMALSDIATQQAAPTVCVVYLTSSTLNLSSPMDYQVLGAVFSGHFGAAVTEIKNATLTSPGAWGRPLALLHPTYPKEKS
jgi:hypothetical protein